VEITELIQQDFLQFEDSVTLAEMAGKVGEHEKRSGLIFRNKKYMGLVEKKKLLKTNMNADEITAKHFLQQTPILQEDTDVIEAARLMFASKIIGVVTDLDLVKSALDLSDLKDLNVRDLKFTKPASIQNNEKVSTAINVMYTNHLDHLPIFEGGKLYGILSYRDLLRKYLNWSPKRDVSARFNKETRSRAAQVDVNSLGDLPVESFSTNDNLVTCQGSDLLSKAIKLMLDKRISDVLVMQDDKFEGILTARSVLGKISESQKHQAFTLQFIGLNKINLTEHQQKIIDGIANREAEKMQRKIPVKFGVAIHLKGARKEGTQQLYSIHLKVDWPGRMLTSTKEDWDVETALHKCFNHVKSALER
jgi:CBS domain-containing protein